MDLDNLQLFKMAITRMSWAEQRQKVLAQNIANSDTPDYKSRDLEKLDFRKVLEGTNPAPVQVARTNPMHLQGTIPQQEDFRTKTPWKPYEETPDKNEVTIEDQMEKLSDTDNDYTAAVTLMEAQMKMFTTAIDKGGS